MGTIIAFIAGMLLLAATIGGWAYIRHRRIKNLLGTLQEYTKAAVEIRVLPEDITWEEWQRTCEIPIYTRPPRGAEFNPFYAIPRSANAWSNAKLVIDTKSSYGRASSRVSLITDRDKLGLTIQSSRYVFYYQIVATAGHTTEFKIYTNSSQSYGQHNIIGLLTGAGSDSLLVAPSRGCELVGVVDM